MKCIIITAIAVITGFAFAPAAPAPQERDEANEATETEVKVTLDQVPQAVRAAIEKEGDAATLREIEKETEHGRILYSADWRAGDQRMEVKYDEAGNVVERETELANADDEDEDEDEDEGNKDEVKVSLEQVPAGVKATIMAEAKDNTIREIEKETEHGSTVYSAKWMVGGTRTEIKVDAAGKVVEREQEEGGEEDDDDDDEGKEDDDEGGEENVSNAKDADFVSAFTVNRADLTSTGKNPYFILEPGFSQTLERNGKQMVITVLDETKEVDGVTTRVVEEREFMNGRVTEISLNYFAIDRNTNDVYYFGEESKEFDEKGNADTGGSWEAGKNGATMGMIMPGKPSIGMRYMQEIAPGDKAMDRAEVVSLNETVEVPAGKFENCLKTQETSASEKGREYKLYAPGVGLLVDGGMKLTKYGKQ